MACGQCVPSTTSCLGHTQTKLRAERQQLSVRLRSPCPELVGACSSASSPCHHAPLPSRHYCQAHWLSTQPLSIRLPQLQAGGTRMHGQPQRQRALCQPAWQAIPLWPCSLRLITGFLSRASGLNSRPSSPGCGWWSQFYQEQVRQQLVVQNISTAWRLLEMQTLMHSRGQIW